MAAFSHLCEPGHPIKRRLCNMTELAAQNSHMERRSSDRSHSDGNASILNEIEPATLQLELTHCIRFRDVGLFYPERLLWADERTRCAELESGSFDASHRAKINIANS